MPVVRSSPRLVLAVLAAAAGGFSLLQSLVTPVLPEIQREGERTKWRLLASKAMPATKY